MQAIITKFFGPTNYRGSRIKATCSGGNIMVNIDHALSSDENHRAAADALVRKLGWELTGYTLAEGGYRHGNAYVVVSDYSRVVAFANDALAAPDKHRPARMWEEGDAALRQIGQRNGQYD